LQTVCHRFNIYAAGSCVAFIGVMTRRWAPPTRYTLRRNTASIMNGLFLFGKKIVFLATRRLDV